MLASNDQKIVLIITTKYYPIKWDKEKDSGLDTLNIGSGNAFNWADFAYGTTQSDEFKKDPCIRTRGFVISRQGNKLTYQVFVVPCLNPDFVTEADQKGKYLEFVIKKCSNDVSFDNVYLIAHDKDFNIEKGEEDYVNANCIINMNSNLLKTLVDIRHVYMFQHEEKREVGGIVSKLNTEKFDDKMCDQLFNIVFGIKDMAEFFTSVDEDVFARFCF